MHGWLEDKHHLAKEQLQQLNEVGVDGMHYWSVRETAIWTHRFNFPIDENLMRTRNV